jgi:hypothetical protein
MQLTMPAMVYRRKVGIPGQLLFNCVFDPGCGSE